MSRNSPEPDPRNRLNDLANRDFLRATKSFWVSEGDGVQIKGWSREGWEAFARWLRQEQGEEAAERLLGQLAPSVLWSRTPPRDRLKHQHPATFSERDVARIIELFTKRGERVLDPFVGSGSTLIACAELERHGTGIELIPRWAEIARQRLEALETGSDHQQLVLGDARSVLLELPENHFQLVVTSPPYWSILRKPPGLKAQAERLEKGLDTRYSDDPSDLGNIADYHEFLDEVAGVLALTGRCLEPGRFMAVVVSDFRHGPTFHLYHADLAARIEDHGLPLKGLTVLVQDNKNLYPFGIPYTFISNIHHQYILIFQEPR